MNVFTGHLMMLVNWPALVFRRVVTLVIAMLVAEYDCTLKVEFSVSSRVTRPYPSTVIVGEHRT